MVKNLSLTQDRTSASFIDTNPALLFLQDIMNIALSYEVLPVFLCEAVNVYVTLLCLTHYLSFEFDPCNLFLSSQCPWRECDFEVCYKN